MPYDAHRFIPSTADDVLRRRVKSELRKRMRGLRGTLPAAACVERSRRIVDALASLAPIDGARAVALFWPMARRREVDLRLLDARLRERGVRVAYPCVDPDAREMRFRFSADAAALGESTAWPGMGLREPPPSAPAAGGDELDVIVVPALAVDPSGHRIGYGRGHYDATLPLFAPPAVTIAVAFDFQLVAELPAVEGDVRVGWVVTDARALRAS